MIVVDNYISDSYLLKEITDDTNWEHSIDFNWKNKQDNSKNIFETIADKIWFDYTPDIIYEGYEYWTHSLTKDSYTVDWHKDKDEHKYKTKGILSHPFRGCIYYAHTELPQGGYLEIMRDNEIERIQPVPNRLIIFDPSKSHRVSSVTEGKRRSLISNIWITKSSEENFL